MAITQIANIAYINQNTLLNSQAQAAALNAPNAQSAMNIQAFSEKMQEQLEVRSTEETKAIDKDGQNASEQEFAQDGEGQGEADAEKKEHINIYGGDGILDIEV